MAEIRDVYSLEFDSATFESQVQSAIATVEQLSEALENGAGSTEELEEATENLISTLKTEATSTQDLNAKRNVLVKTQQNLTKESKSYNAVSQQLNTTNKQLATSTGQAATAQKGFFGGLVNGARQINSLKRAASTLGSILRVVAGISIGGLLTAAIPAAIGLLGRLFGAAKDTKSELDKLNDPETGLIQRREILEAEINNLNSIERANGALTEEQKKQRDELVTKYNDTAAEIKRIEEDRIREILRLENQIQRARIKLITDTSSKILATAAQDTKELFQSTTDDFRKLLAEQQKLLRDAEALRAKGNVNAANEAEIAARNIQTQIDKIVELEQAEKEVIKTEAQQALAREQQQRILSTSLAALEKQLNELRKIQSEQTDALNVEQQKAIQGQIDAQLKLVNEAKALLADLQGVEKAKANIAKLTTDLIIDDSERRIQELRANAEKELSEVVGTEEQKAEQIRLINEKLQRDIAEIQEKQTDDLISESQKQRDEYVKTRNEAIQQDIELTRTGEQTKLAITLQGIETRRNTELQNAQTNIQDAEALKTAVESINKRFDAERLAAEKATQQAILQAEIAAVQKLIEVRSQLAQPTAEQAAELEKLKLQLIELQRSTPPVEVEVETETAEDKTKELVKNIAEATLEIQKVVFDAINKGYETLIAQIDESIDRSKSALSEIRENSEDFNARQLELEKERLEKLEKERERAVQRQKTLAIIQIAIDTAVAVAKAASQSGVAAPITIATTIAAIVGGIASAFAVAQGANFFEGSEYVDKENRYPAGRDTVPARLNKGERVITTATNRQYYESLSAIHHHRVPAGVLNNFVKNWDRTESILPQIDGHISFVGIQADNSELKNELSQIKELLSNITGTTVTVNANARGIYKIVERRKSQSQITNRIRKRG